MKVQFFTQTFADAPEGRVELYSNNGVMDIQSYEEFVAMVYLSIFVADYYGVCCRLSEYSVRVLKLDGSKSENLVTGTVDTPIVDESIASQEYKKLQDVQELEQKK